MRLWGGAATPQFFPLPERLDDVPPKPQHDHRHQLVTVQHPIHLR